MKRRLFLTRVAYGLPVLALAACTKKSEKPEMSEEEIKKLREGAKEYHDQVKFVSEGDPVAKTLKYVEDPTKGMASLRQEKEGVPGNEQICSNCQFYIPKEGKAYGECQLLQGRGMVPEGAWCASWAKKREMPAAG